MAGKIWRNCPKFRQRLDQDGKVFVRIFSERVEAVSCQTVDLVRTYKKFKHANYLC